MYDILISNHTKYPQCKHIMREVLCCDSDSAVGNCCLSNSSSPFRETGDLSLFGKSKNSFILKSLLLASTLPRFLSSPPLPLSSSLIRDTLLRESLFLFLWWGSAAPRGDPGGEGGSRQCLATSLGSLRPPVPFAPNMQPLSHAKGWWGADRVGERGGKAGFFSLPAESVPAEISTIQNDSQPQARVASANLTETSPAEYSSLWSDWLKAPSPLDRP